MCILLNNDFYDLLVIHLILFLTRNLKNVVVWCPKHLKCFDTIADVIYAQYYDDKSIRISTLS